MADRKQPAQIPKHRESMTSPRDVTALPSPPSQRYHRHHVTIRGFQLFRRMGPGLVTGAADDDPSGIGTYSQVGAAFGFQMLWATWLAFPLAAAVQETAGRLGLVGSCGLAQLIKQHFPRPILMVAVLLVCVANTFNIGADLGSMVAAIRLLVPLPHY